MEEKRIYEFYDYLLRIIGAESRNMLYENVYESAKIEFANKFFPDDDERHYQFLSFFELHFDRLEKEHGFITVKYKNEKPKEVGLTKIGEYVCTLGSYQKYKNEQEALQKRIEEEDRQKREEETNERKWNIRNNISQTILCIITILPIIGGWILGETDNNFFTLIIFIAGCLLGYGVGNRKRKHCQNK